MADEFDQYKAQPADEFAQYKVAGANTTPNSPIPANAGIAPGPAPTDLGGKLSLWAQNVADDIKYGTDRTGVGTVLKKMGAHGVYNGNSEKVGDFMASLPLGLAKTVEGAGQVMGGSQGDGMLEGAGKMISGAAQAATFPAAFSGMEAGVNVLPEMANAKRAGQILGNIESKIGHVPIELNEPGWKALDIKRLSQQGDSAAPKPVRDFITRILDTNQPPLTFKEARSFYSNAVRKLTPEELQKLSPRMRRELGGFADTLDSALGDTADDHGLGQQYEDAMQEYRTAMRRQAKVQRVKDAVINVGQSAVGKGIGAGIGGGIGYGLWKELSK